MTEMQSQPQSQSDYHYNPPSAQSTRQILESTSPTSRSTSNNDQSVPLRPQTLTRQKSSNYAEAEADARARTAAQTAESAHTASRPPGDAAGDGRDEAAATAAGDVKGTVGWKPKMGRKQSWNQQDLKRVMQMSVMNESQGSAKEPGPGFSEVGKDTEKKG